MIWQSLMLNDLADANGWMNRRTLRMVVRFESWPKQSHSEESLRGRFGDQIRYHAPIARLEYVKRLRRAGQDHAVRQWKERDFLARQQHQGDSSRCPQEIISLEHMACGLPQSQQPRACSAACIASDKKNRPIFI